MPELSRSQVLVYGAVAVALLLVGARAIRGRGRRRIVSQAQASSAGSSAAASGGFSISGQGGDVVVDVTGAVRRPGVYRLPAGSRVDRRGRSGRAAPRRERELEAINLAARLADGQQVVVPERVRVAPTATAAAGPKTARSASAPPPSSSSKRSTGSARSRPATSSSSATSTAASPRSTSSTRCSGIGPATMESLRARLQP